MLATTSASFPQRKNLARLHSANATSLPRLCRILVANSQTTPRARFLPGVSPCSEAASFVVRARCGTDLCSSARGAAGVPDGVCGTGSATCDQWRLQSSAQISGCRGRSRTRYYGCRQTAQRSFRWPANRDRYTIAQSGSLPHTVCENTGNAGAFVTSRTALHRRDR